MAAVEVTTEAPYVVGGMQYGSTHTPGTANLPPPRSGQDHPVVPLSSQRFKPPALDLSQAPSHGISVAHENELETSSSSAVSSQEHASWSVEQLTGDRAHAVHEDGSPTSSPENDVQGGLSRHGSKRTANGQVKNARDISTHEIKTEGGTRHSRTSSLLSTTSNGSVLELSQQLRTRLTYAMVKVQNGWQTRSLDEVESLASRSPRSTVSAFPQNHGRPLQSPRSVMSTNLQRSWSSSNSSDDVGEQPFRQDLPGARPISTPRVHQAEQGKRGLAPPADIIPGSRRRPTKESLSKEVAIHGIYSPSRRPLSSRPAPKPRTPSQNAAMEADAVETLLFMASPNNSSHHPSTVSQQQSSIRSTQLTSSQPLMSPKKVAFQNNAPPQTRTRTTRADIDRLLEEDSSDDDSSNDLDDAIARGPGRSTAR